MSLYLCPRWRNKIDLFIYLLLELVGELCENTPTRSLNSVLPEAWQQLSILLYFQIIMSRVFVTKMTMLNFKSSIFFL